MQTETILLRLGCAIFAGVVLGIERERNGHAAGLRTTILVSLTPALATIGCQVIEEATALGRIAQGIFAGVGFIGGGAILKHDSSLTVRGITTAAVLWIATMLGFSFGLGQYLVGFIGLTVAVITVYTLQPLSRRMRMRWNATLTVTFSNGALTAKQGAELLEKLGIQVNSTSFEFHGDAAATHTIHLAVTYDSRDALDLPVTVYSTLMSLPGVIYVKWQ